MTDKTMPERIYAGYDLEGCRTWSGFKPLPGGSNEYIRADLVHGDPIEPFEPFENGQYRWVEIGGQWIAGKISGSSKHNLYFYDVDGNETPLTALGVIGPVIRPPADTTNYGDLPGPDQNLHDPMDFANDAW